MYNLDEILSLLQKRIDGSISEEELTILENYASANPYFHQLLEKIGEDGVLWDDLVEKLELEKSDNDSWEERLKIQTIRKIRDHEINIPPVKLKRMSWLRIASLLLITLSISTLFILYQQSRNSSNIEIVSEIPTPSSKAILRLDNGKVIELNSAKSGLLIDNGLSYVDGTSVGNDSELSNIEMLSLEVPKGGNYHLVLGDGTKVWLNSGSVLKYPLKFKNNERLVELSGEGYFEVSTRYHQDHADQEQVRTPFLIHTKRQIIEVLGTAFNVEAYADDKVEKTSLVHGKVRVREAHRPAGKLNLNPGEQSIISNSAIEKTQFNTDDVLGWKDNKFIFNNTDLSQALNVLSRWYDFDVRYEGEIPQSQFYAEINRSNKLTTVLKTLEKGGVKFRMEKQDNRFRLVVKK
ncbi:FecR family protein [Sphingobacterium sp. BN32]|uniref:FecR family protein n=1 Tax=Sphingobacterium sp. BN32 TaxID=3058432 RepID=UPI00265D39BA|nr:FecR family protein [Sphingobacterium sp. BN32]WKK57807.1 DUF4974 domain-containing protein [Sphingobacterium sp. BN32]